MLSKKTISSSLWLLLIYLSMSCNSTKTKVPTIAELIVDSIYLPIKLSDITLNGINSDYKLNESIEYLNSSQDRITRFMLSSGDTLTRKSVSKYKKILEDYFVRNNDSIYIITSTNFIYLIHKDSIIKKWDLNGIVKQIDSFSFCANLGPSDFNIINDTLLIDLSNSRERTDFSGPPKEFYQYGFKILVDISQNTPKLIAKFNPYPNFFQNQDYYSFYQGTLTKKLDVIYAFNYSDTIYKYSFKTKHYESARIKSTYFEPNIPVKYDSIFDYKYLNNYEITQSRNSLFFYNHKLHLIYFFIKHKSKPVESDGTINEYYDCPFSLVIISEDFTKQKEYFVPANFFDKHYLAFCAKDYLYLPADESKQHVKGKTLYYRLKFNF